MAEADELLEIFRTRAQRDQLDRHLSLHRLARIDDDEFALTPRTRRLRRWDDEEVDDPAQPQPSAVIQLVPTERVDRRWSLRDSNLIKWLSLDERRYAPYKGGLFLWLSLRTVCGGIIFEHKRSEGMFVQDYIFLGQDGLIEIGLCKSAVRYSSGSPRGETSDPAQTYFLLLPLVGTLWRCLQFAHEWYEMIKLESDVSLIVAGRATAGSQLAGFADGWEEPWNSFRGTHSICTDPALRIVYPTAKTGDADTVESFVREVAIEFEAGWGVLTDTREARCFVAPNRDKADQFDENSFAQMMR